MTDRTAVRRPHWQRSTRRGMVRTGAVAAAVVAVGASMLTACGDDSSSNSQVTLLTHDSFDLPQSVFDEFKKETGQTLKVVKSGDAGQRSLSSWRKPRQTLPRMRKLLLRSSAKLRSSRSISL